MRTVQMASVGFKNPLCPLCGSPTDKEGVCTECWIADLDDDGEIEILDEEFDE